jgi:hypothetical protein
LEEHITSIFSANSKPSKKNQQHAGVAACFDPDDADDMIL